MKYPSIEYFNPAKRTIVSKVLTLPELDKFFALEPDWPFLAMQILTSYSAFNLLRYKDPKEQDSVPEGISLFELSEDGLKKV